MHCCRRVNARVFRESRAFSNAPLRHIEYSISSHRIVIQLNPEIFPQASQNEVTQEARDDTDRSDAAHGATRNARRLRWLELALVLTVAFALPLFGSTVAFLTSARRDAHVTDLRLIPTLISEATGLAVLFYVLFRQGRSVRELGFRWNPQKLPMTIVSAILLAIGAVIASFASRVGLDLAYLTATGHQMNWHSEKMPIIAVSVVTVLFMVLNGAFEELVVRAYALTEVEALTKNTAWAVAFSVLFQTSYHFYQGAPVALSYAPLFLVFALYYVRTRDIAPVVLAHILIDMWSLFLVSGH